MEGKRNALKADGAFLRNVDVDLVGDDNRIDIGAGSVLRDVRLHIRGDNNRLQIGRDCRLNRGADIWLDDGATLIIGDGSTFESVHLAVVEKTTLTIGERCMFATDIEVRTGDSHSLLDAAGVRINHAQDVTIGDHVWVGARAIILKGGSLPAGTVVASGAVVASAPDEEHSLIAGNPARTIRTGVSWDRALL